MKQIVAVLVVVLPVIPACVEESAEGPETVAPAPEESEELTPEPLLERYDELRSRQRRGFVIPPPNTVFGEDPPKLSGQWIEKGGVRECDGYLTGLGDEEFCSSVVPEDWAAFEYEGRLYYLQPLAEGDGRSPPPESR